MESQEDNNSNTMEERRFFHKENLKGEKPPVLVQIKNKMQSYKKTFESQQMELSCSCQAQVHRAPLCMIYTAQIHKHEPRLQNRM